jgi:hypothetical protein
MRVLGLVFAGALALTAPTAAQAGPLGSKMERAGARPTPGVVQVWDGNRLGGHRMSNA